MYPDDASAEPTGPYPADAPATSHVAQAVADVVHREWSRLMATLVSDLGDLDLAEDVAQEALEVALQRWNDDGIPDRPGAWITTVARRRAIDRLRRDENRRKKAELAARLEERAGEVAEPDETVLRDEQLRLVFACCHPTLRVEAQMALTLRCIAGLTTREIASAFLVPEATMAQRLVRAKKKISTAGIPFVIPPDLELLNRLRVVHHVLYLIFNEGYARAEGDQLMSHDLCDEAIRLGRITAELMADDAETLGLLALMLLLHARRDTRTDEHGDIVLLNEQDRSRWDQALIAEGEALLEQAVRLAQPGPYQIQAAINALHAEAETAADTDWVQIEHLYGTLVMHGRTPVVGLNHGVAIAMAYGPEKGLTHLDRLTEPLDDYGYYHAARADLHRRLGDDEAAGAAYRRAIELTANAAELRFLRRRLDEL